MNETIQKISEDENNRLIITTYQKLYYFQDGKFIPLPAEKQRNPHASYSGKPGSVWIIELGGITHQKNGTETFYPLNLKLEIAKLLPQTPFSYTDESIQGVVALNSFEDSGGSLWIGGFFNRLFRLREGSFEIFTAADILGSEKPFNFLPILDDEKGNIWISTVNISYSLYKTETRLIKYDGKNFESIKTNVFFDDGLTDREGNL